MTGLVILLWAAIVAYVARSHEDVARFRRLSAPVLLGTLLLQFLSQLFYNGVLLVPLRTYVKELGYWRVLHGSNGGIPPGGTWCPSPATSPFDSRISDGAVSRTWISPGRRP